MNNTLRAVTIVLVASGCALNSHMSPRQPATMDQLWQEPRDVAQRDLLVGEFGAGVAPDLRDQFEVTGTKTTGTQSGYDVKDGTGREWSVKLGVEARVEVTVSRILWAIGYHQPPVYYVPKWTRVENGKSVSEEAARFRPHIALLDIGMPHLNGYEVARKIRAAPWGANIRLFAATGWGQEKDKLLAKEAGFDVHLTKPIDFKQLLALLEEHGGKSG